MSLTEIISDIILFLWIVGFGGACIWTMYTLDKDDKKHKKHKKA
jgi:hypothetical protein